MGNRNGTCVDSQGFSHALDRAADEIAKDNPRIVVDRGAKAPYSIFAIWKGNPMPREYRNHPLQAIVTKYLGPSNVRGSRIKASAAAGSVTVSYNHALNSEDNHLAAAETLARKYGWLDNHGAALHAGGMPDSRGNVYVMVRKGEAESLKDFFEYNENNG